MELGQFLQVVGAVGSGGQAKMMIQSGVVTLNGEVETRRRKKLEEGDRISFEGRSWIVQLDPSSPRSPDAD